MEEEKRKVEELIKEELRFKPRDYVFYIIWLIGLLALIYAMIFERVSLAINIAIGLLYGLFLGLREEMRGQRAILMALLKLHLKG